VGNFVGTDVSCTLALGNGSFGIGTHVSLFPVSGNYIGAANPANPALVGLGAAARNVIVGTSGNAQTGISLVSRSGQSVADNIVQGNYVGLNAAGTDKLGIFNIGIDV